MDIQKLLDKASKQPCILCGGHGFYGAMFIPDKEHQELFGAPDGKERMMFYSICESCKASSNRSKRIESIILAGIRKNNAIFN